MRMAILMLWGSGCVLSFRTHLYAFGFWRIMDGAVIMYCYRERYHGGFMHGGFIWAFTTGRIIIVGTRIGIFRGKGG
jgi:hypothetical protein